MYIDTIQQLAIAQSLHRLDGDYAGLKYKVKNKISLLVCNDIVSPFFELILDFLETERKLIDVSASSYKKMREKKLSRPQWQLAYETLNYISFYLLKNVQDKILGKSNQQIRNIIATDNKKVADLQEIARFMKQEEKLISEVTILENLDYTFEFGWHSNTLKEVWLRREKLEFDPTKLKKFILGESSSQSGGNGSSTSKKKSEKKTTTSTSTSTPLWDKTQRARDCPPVRDHTNGGFFMPCTTLKVEKNECMNFNLWGICALGNKCKKKKRCVFCKESTHGVRSCQSCVFEDYIKDDYK